MSAVETALQNPDAIVAAVTTVLAWLGVDRWRKKRRASTLAEVDRWASTAAGAVELGVKLGVIQEADAATEALRRCRILAAAAGVTVSPDHEARALLLTKEALTRAGQFAVETQATRLRAAGEALLENLERLFPAAPPKR
jgi:hypothetical protein